MRKTLTRIKANFANFYTLHMKILLYNLKNFIEPLIVL